MRQKIFVVTRYSVLNKALHTWQLARDAADMQRYEQQLFEPGRLAERLALYKGITLPSLVAQLPALASGASTVEFVVGVLVADRLPDTHRQELEAALAETLGSSGVNYEILTVAPERESVGGAVDAADADRVVHTGMGVAIDDLIRRHIEGDTVFATVRLDDDDALAPNLLMRVAGYLKPDLARMHLSFSDGLQGFVDPVSMTATDVRLVSKPKIALGLCFINSYIAGEFASEALHVHRFAGHREIDSLTPVVVDARGLAYFRTMSPSSDIGDARHAKNELATAEQISELALAIALAPGGTTATASANSKASKPNLGKLFRRN